MQLDLNLGAPLSVTELTRRIKGTLESSFPDVWVQGEVTGLRVPSSGHMYFALKDAGAQVRAVFFRSGNRYLKFRPEDGLEVTLRGRVTLYEQRGEYQLTVEYMEPKGLGALQLAFIQLKERLEKEGLFDPARKRPLPEYPKRVGVVTSPTGAAVRDILDVLGRRAPGVHVVIAPASVQGESAPAEIAAAIAELNELGGLDVIIAGRGGGSMEDLAAFNTEAVARAIHASAIPVISAVGHETDVTIADFVADLRAATPSAAAELVAASEEETASALRSLTSRLAYTTTNTLELARARLASAARGIRDPRRHIQERFQRVDDLVARLGQSATYNIRTLRESVRSSARSIEYMSPARRIPQLRESVDGLALRLARGSVRLAGQRRDRLSSSAARLSALAPLAPLARGFMLAYRMPEMGMLRGVSDVSPGDVIRLRAHDGELDCRVENILDGPSAWPEQQGDDGEK